MAHLDLTTFCLVSAQKHISATKLTQQNASGVHSKAMLNIRPLV